MLKDKILEKLLKEFPLGTIVVEDESDRHIGHVGAREGGETHFSVLVVSELFKDVSQVNRHRRVYQLLKPEFKEKIHALALKTYTPEEFADI